MVGQEMIISKHMGISCSTIWYDFETRRKCKKGQAQFHWRIAWRIACTVPM